MDFIRDILFGEADQAGMVEDDSPEVISAVSEDSVETLDIDEEDDTAESLPDTESIAKDISSHLLESLDNYYDTSVADIGLRETWREMYYRLKYNNTLEIAEYDENTNKTDEKKAEDIFRRSELEFVRCYNIMSADWKQYDSALEEFMEKLENPVDVSFDSVVKDDEEKFLHLTDFSESEVTEREQHSSNFNEVNNSPEVEVNMIKVKLQDSEVDQVNDTLLEENKALKFKLEKLQRIKQNIKERTAINTELLIKKVDEILNARISGGSNNFTNTKEEHERIVKENELLMKTVEENDKNIFSLYTLRDEDNEQCKSLLLDKSKLGLEKKLVKSKCKSLERKNKYLLKEIHETSAKLEEKLVNNEIQLKEREAKLSCFLKHMDMFKEETEKRLETRVKRLEDINLKLSKDNHELRCKILDQNLHGIMAMVETKVPQSPQ